MSTMLLQNAPKLHPSFVIPLSYPQAYKTYRLSERQLFMDQTNLSMEDNFSDTEPLEYYQHSSWISALTGAIKRAYLRKIRRPNYELWDQISRNVSILPQSPRLSVISLVSPLPRSRPSTLPISKYNASYRPKSPPPYTDNIPSSGRTSLEGANIASVSPVLRVEPTKNPAKDAYHLLLDADDHNNGWLPQSAKCIPPKSPTIQTCYVQELKRRKSAPLRRRRRRRDLKASAFRSTLTPVIEDDRSTIHERSPPVVGDSMRPMSPHLHGNDEMICSLEHFNAFCILDTMTDGQPVILASEDIWVTGKLKQEEQYFLNHKHALGEPAQIITDTDADGNERTYLILSNKLPSPTTGQDRLLLIFYIDITKFLDELTIDEINVEGFMMRRYENSSYKSTEEVLQPNTWSSSHSGSISSPSSQGEDIWIALAREDCSPAHARMDRARTECRTKSNAGARDTHCKEPSTDEDIKKDFQDILEASLGLVQSTMEDVTRKLFKLYRNYFILRPSRFDRFYEISHVSPDIYVEDGSIKGHLSKTPRATIEQLRQDLARERRFSLGVKWGEKGDDKRLYCMPVFGPNVKSWACMLIDADRPLLWKT